MSGLLEIMKQYWGYESYLPLQREAMESVLASRDSLVVLPTGGGKSLCFQVPALAMEGMALVVSPLISLMKDQVDALHECGVEAECLHSNLAPEEVSRAWEGIRERRVKLLYVSPERLLQGGFLDRISQNKISFIAIDEVHCVSMWGHDFRPEYRGLRVLKERFEGIAIHGYTATATEHVRDDIVRELCLVAPEILVGSFHRSNLIYKVERSATGAAKTEQICKIIARHPGESGIVYCITRKNVDTLTYRLSANGIKAIAYHAGMESDARRKAQEAFIREEVDVVVATVAFGMGIDKSNVRFVIHASMPKSLEHYQQESGRAGRDGLEADCCLFHSYADYMSWQRMLDKSDDEGRASDDPTAIAMEKLDSMLAYCEGVDCRHKGLLAYFGEDLAKDNCGACDVCLEEVDRVDNAQVIGQKILSCVVRLNEFFGGSYTARVLAGSSDKRILENGHEKLSTYGILAEHQARAIQGWISELASQQFLRREGDYKILKVTEKGWRLIRGEGNPILLKPAKRESRKAPATATEMWEGVERGLFEELRALRRELAQAKDLPPYAVFGDEALRDMARRRPSTHEGFLQVKGVAQRKCDAYGDLFLKPIAVYCAREGVATDVAPPAGSYRRERIPRRQRSPIPPQAREGFLKGRSIEQIAKQIGRAPSTTIKYLVEHIAAESLTDISHWVDAASFSRVEETAKEHGESLLRPLFDAMDGEVSYDHIRLTLACLRNRR